MSPLSSVILHVRRKTPTKPRFLLDFPVISRFPNQDSSTQPDHGTTRRPPSKPCPRWTLHQNFAPRMSRSTLSLCSIVTPQSRSTELLQPSPTPTAGGYLLEGALLGRLAQNFCLQVVAICVCGLFLGIASAALEVLGSSMEDGTPEQTQAAE